MKRLSFEILLPVPFDYGFSYFAPDGFPEVFLPEIGDVVKVPFRSKEMFGVVIGANQETNFDDKKIKTIISINEKVKFSPKLLEFIDWVANYNLAPKKLWYL